MGERGTRRICLEIRDHGAWLYFESSASKKHCQALITYTFFFSGSQGRDQKVVPLRRKTIWKKLPASRRRKGVGSFWMRKQSFPDLLGPQIPWDQKTASAPGDCGATTHPYSPKVSLSPCTTQPGRGENFPPPPPLRVGSTGERRRRRSCPSRARKALGAWEAAWCLCLWRPPTSPPSTWRARRKQRRQAFAQRTELSPDTRPELLARPSALVTSTTGPPGLIPISWPPRPQNSGCSLLGPRSQLHPRAPLPPALLPTHTAPAHLPPRRLDRRFLATARMRPTPPGTTGAAVCSLDQLVRDLEKVNKTPLLR